MMDCVQFAVWLTNCYAVKTMKKRGSCVMFHETCVALSKSAQAKLSLLNRHPLGYFISSMVCGMFISFGGFVSLTMGALAGAAGCTVTKLVMATLFASALSLVITAGGELFTGNNLTMTAGALEGDVSWGDVVKVWVVCWIGNLVGSWLTVLIYALSGAGTSEVIAMQFATMSAAKVALTPVQMVARGILCNTCVCLAVWCAARLQTEIGKLVMSLWCILIFMICGFEHSVANMSIIGVALLNPMGEAVNVLGYATNLFFVTIGNIIGGACFVALPYWAISRK